ncbi:MAG: DUF1802 family protein [Phycisphaerae bacterium]|nr:DUF1802 family protein [Tepidisphaeraceae bacterium]
MSQPLPESIGVGLKEWATVVGAMGDGNQVVLLRKGGIYESAGEFEVEHREFVYFPTYLHQSLNQLKPAYHAGFTAHSAEPSRVTLGVAGRVTDIIQLKSREQMDELDDQHIWAPPLLDMRFNYKPANPLYLLIVRAWRLAAPVTVENTPAYAGCKSWVPLERAVETGGATVALEDTDFQTKREVIRARLSGEWTGF